MFFESWSSVGRVLLTGVCVYVALVLLLRISGKRTLAKMNAFDFVVTVALGSTLATVVTSKQVPLVDGVVALALLIGLQFAIAWSATRSQRLNGVIKSQPRVVFHDGSFARAAMRDERITEDEIRAAIRQASVGGFDQVESVILESSGEISVVRREGGGGGAQSAVLEGVRFDDPSRDRAPREEGAARS